MQVLRRQWAALVGVVLLGLAALGCQPAGSAERGAPAAANPQAARPQPAAAAPAPTPLPVRIVHSTRNGSQAIAQVLVDSGALADNGLIGTLQHVDGPARAIPVLLTGEADVALMGGEAALSAAVEGAEVVIIGGFLNRRDHVLFAGPGAANVADLRGKRVGINGVGAADQRAILEAFQHFRLDPQEVTFVTVAGGPANRLAAIQSGAVDATGLQPPLTGRARTAGLRALVSIGQVVERELPVNAIVASRAGVAERPETFRRFIRAMVQGVHLYGSQPDVVRQALAAFFALDLAEHYADLEETRAHYAPLYPALPSIPVDGYRLALDELAETNPRAAEFRLATVFDDRFVADVDRSGLVRELYGRN